jgi:hypothetical protein
MFKKSYKFKIRSKQIQLVIDKILLLKLMRELNGRFWGLFSLIMLDISLILCFYIRPELRDISTAFSEFGTYAETAPYFTAGLFAGAYGLWRWRNYISRSSKNPGLVTLLLTIIIISFFMIAFSPLGLNNTVDLFHYFGFGLAGIGMILTVVADLLFRKTKEGKHKFSWQLVRILSLLMIVFGGVITVLSSEKFGYELGKSLLGESLVLTGFGIWVLTRTYQGEGVQTGFAKILHKVLIIE